MLGESLTVREKSRLYSLQVPINDGGVCRTTYLQLANVGEHREVSVQLAEAQASGSELEIDVVRLCKTNRVFDTWISLVTILEGKADDAWRQSEHNFASPHTRFNAAGVCFMLWIEVVFFYRCYFT